jgi:hypothetical protein
MKATTHLHLQPRSRNAWSYTPLPQYVFMAWCLVKHRDNFTFTFILFFRCVISLLHAFYGVWRIEVLVIGLSLWGWGSINWEALRKMFGPKAGEIAGRCGQWHMTWSNIICTLHQIRGCIQKFPDWVDSEMNNNKHSLSSNTKGYGGKTH